MVTHGLWSVHGVVIRGPFSFHHFWWRGSGRDIKRFNDCMSLQGLKGIKRSLPKYSRASESPNPPKIEFSASFNGCLNS